MIPKDIKRLSNSQSSFATEKNSELYIIGSNVSISIFDTLSCFLVAIESICYYGARRWFEQVKWYFNTRHFPATFVPSAK